MEYTTKPHIRNKTHIASSGNLERYFELMDEYPALFKCDDECDALSLVLDKDILLKEQQAIKDIGALVNRPPHYYTLGVLGEDELQVFLRDLVRYPDGLLIPSERHVYKMKVSNRAYAIIIPHADGKILLTRRFTRPYRQWEWLVPVVYLHANEGFFNQTCMEVSDMTGYQITKLAPLLPMCGSNTAIFIAEVTSQDGIQPVNLSGTAGESRWFSLSELEREILNGSVTDSSIMAAYIHILHYGLEPAAIAK